MFITLVTAKQNMQSYTLLYSKIWKQVVSMVVVPVFTIIPFILVLTQYKNLDDTTVFILIYAALAVIILLTLFVVFKQAHVPVVITIHDSEIEIVFKRKTLFNWLVKKNIPLSQVEYVSDDEDVNHNSRKFFTIKLKNEWGKIILVALKKTPANETEQFSLELVNAVEQFNSQNKNISAPIRRGSFYTGFFAKAFTYIFIAVVVIVTIIKITDPSKIEWYRIVWIYILATSWFANFYYATRREKRKTKNSFL